MTDTEVLCKFLRFYYGVFSRLSQSNASGLNYKISSKLHWILLSAVCAQDRTNKSSLHGPMHDNIAQNSISSSPPKSFSRYNFLSHKIAVNDNPYRQNCDYMPQKS